MPKKAQQLPSIIQVVGGNPTSAGFLPPPPPMLDPLSIALTNVSANPYIIGVFYIILNLGGRFLSMELTKRQEWFLAQPYVRPLILFSVMFIATRNLAVAFWSTIFILSVLWLFANENSALCLIPEWRNDKTKHDEADKAYQEKMKKLEDHDGGDYHPPHDEQEHQDDDVHNDEENFTQAEQAEQLDEQFNDTG